MITDKGTKAMPCPRFVKSIETTLCLLHFKLSIVDFSCDLDFWHSAFSRGMRKVFRDIYARK